MSVLIMGQARRGAYGVYGHGPTADDARRYFRRNGGNLRANYAVVTFDADTEFRGVDEFGRYHYRGNAPTVEEVNA